MMNAPVAMVTGGAQGLGAAICTVLLKEGYKVCVADIQETKGRNFVKEQQEIYGSKTVLFSHCDVSKEDDYERTFDISLKEFGKIDVVVNNAGILKEQDPWKVFQVNLMGPMIGCQKAIKYMGKTNGGKGGIVINTASVAGIVPVHTAPAYVASKHGVVGLTRSYGLPYHLERDGIIYMAICPYVIDTDLFSSSRNNSLVPDLDIENTTKMSPEYAAKGVLKLLQDRINGSTLVISKDGYKYVGYPQELMDTVFD